MKNIRIITLTALASSFFACQKDFLETAPSDAISEVTVQNSEDALKNTIDGIHSYMYLYNWGRSTHLFGAGHASILSRIDLMGDDVINTKSSYHMGVYRYEDVRDADNGELNFKTWDFYYSVINNANRAINIAKKSSAPENDKIVVLGQAYAFRAYAYHYLVQLFAKRYEKSSDNSSLGVILRTDENLDDVYKYMPRSTVAQTYELIDSDIQKALEYLKSVKEKGLEREGKNVISYAAACGIATRIALTKEDWANAEKYARLTIEEAKARGNSLQVGDALIDGFNNANASEWIWGYTPAQDQANTYFNFMANYAYNVYAYNDSFRFAVNRDIFDEMGENDVRRKWWVCADLPNSVQIPADASQDYFYNWEITGQNIKFRGIDGKMAGDTLLMRLAEFYYSLAEALNRQGKDAEALGILKEIMQTRDSNYSTTATAGEPLFEEIMRNKRLDLWLEGHRFFDIKRQRKVFDRSKSKNIQTILTGPDQNTAILRNTGVNARMIPTSVDSKNWQFLIPRSELDGNKECVQNEL